MNLRNIILGVGGAAAILLLTSTPNSTAQTPDGKSIPIVSVQATDAWGTWAGDTGTFTIFRTGNRKPALNVYICISGTASNGVDYKSIGNFVQLPSGVMSNSVTINPIDLGQTNLETVRLELCPSPLASLINYSVGEPSMATVFITPVGMTNLPPTVRIVAPTNGAEFFGEIDCPPCATNNPPCEAPCYFHGPTIFICADSVDLDGYVDTVEFFANGVSLGVSTNCPVCAYPANPFCFAWTNVPPGSYSLIALAKDNLGAMNVSDPISISVLDASPPKTNLPPQVKIVSPTNGTIYFDAPVDIGLIAKAADADGQVTNVEFYAGGNDLGAGNLLALDAPGVNGIVGLVYVLSWTNVPAGNYSVNAVASDNLGATNVSVAVSITVSNGLPPPPFTNLPPNVRIASPHDGAVFRGPLDLPLFAYAFSVEATATLSSGPVTNVEFYADGRDLGRAEHVLSGPPPGPIMPQYLIILPHNFFLLWSNAPVGQHVLAAVAVNQLGNSATSTPVRISVLPVLPPSTNRPAPVSIVASDPVAIEGTNCWPWLGLTAASPTWSAWETNHVYRFFTNCGPKNASFTVRRSGDTNDDLIVAYSIGGSATNGLDYVTLSGTVTIPAGERSVILNVVPMENDRLDPARTVVLTLLPDTNAHTEYVLGQRRRAAAVILDGPLPGPVTALLPDRRFHLAASGPDGAWFRVEYSTDLANWTSICTNQVVNGSIDFIDPDTANAGGHFYRAVPESGPPAE